jgi:hypothetical protein
MGPSVDYGVEQIISAINTTPGPFVLSGLSQGAMVCSKVYNEIRYGRLAHRRGDFLAGIMFGNPARQAGHTIDLVGATDPGGSGLQQFPIRQSYGETYGILSNCEPFWWEFANPGDPACTTVDGAAKTEIARVFKFIYNGWTGIGTLASLLVGLVSDPTGSAGAMQWLIDTTSATTSPHIEYHLPYTPLTGNTTESAVDLAVTYLNSVAANAVSNPPVKPGPSWSKSLDFISENCENWRQTLLNKRKQKPYIRIWKNKENGDPGLEYVGRIHYDDTIRASFPMKKNESAQGVIELRTNHYISEFIRNMVTTEELKKNVVITVDMYGGELRWSGLLKSHSIKVSDEGLRYHELTFNDDMQFLQFLLAPPNPVLPLEIFQFPRVFTMVGPAKWAISVMVLLNLIRVEGNLWSLPDDPFDLDQWDNMFPWSWKDWQVHIKCDPFMLDDSTLWVLLASRMNPVDSVIADALDDAQLTLRYRRVFSDLGEVTDGVMFVEEVANGALVFELTDDSGYHSPLSGTFLEGTIADGLVRSAAVYAGGFVEDTLAVIADNEGLYPDQYWGPGFLGTLAEAPWLVIRDSQWTMINTAELTWSPATAVAVVVGGDNPAADALAKLIIETVGNLLGYFLLGGFSSAGTIAADIIMPFLRGTIAAWIKHKHTARATALGWVHLWELYQQGGEQNAWSLSALAALRGGFLATRSETSHTFTLKGTRWILPGLHFSVGSRVGSTVKEYPNYIFVNQVEGIEMTWDHTGDGGLDFSIQIGSNKSAMSMGERQARAMQKAITTLNNIGVNLISA